MFAERLDIFLILFQFESADLDFGIYRILHLKRTEIRNFIDGLLTDTVKKQLAVFDAEQEGLLQRQLQELEEEKIIQDYQNADDADRSVLYKFNKEKIDAWQKLKEQQKTGDRNRNTEEAVYNHLALFFSRYYDKGDFISKRRHGKTEKYVVPYNGEETHFYWANHDQYYIKSGEYFQHFSFKAAHLGGTLAVHFRLVAAQTVQGNVKADEARFFVPAAQAPELDAEGQSLTLFFEFRPLNEGEKATFTGNSKQDALDAAAAAQWQQQLAAHTITAELWKTDDKGQTLLLRKLRHFTRKNSHDFFIHKDLRGFLQRELDFYIKTELVRVEELYVLDSEQHFEEIRHNFRLIKCFKAIADVLIDFLAQVEHFQKKLWEKKKFVLRTDWIITLDKLAGWLTPEAIASIVEAALANEAQVTEWKKLFGWEVLPFALTADGLKENLHEWRKLPIDTAHFGEVFKEALLGALSNAINLEAEAHGLVLHSDNYHGLQLLQEKYQEQVKCIYIDPPYNTEQDRAQGKFIYKDGFTHASWISLMDDRSQIAINLLKKQGTFFCSIDDNELTNCRNVFDRTIGANNFIDYFTWIRTSSASNLSKKSKKLIEFLLCYEKEKNSENRYRGLASDKENDNPLIKRNNNLKTLRFPKDKLEVRIKGDHVLSKDAIYGTSMNVVRLVENNRLIDGHFESDLVLESNFIWEQKNLDDEIDNGTRIIIKSLSLAPRYDKESYEAAVPGNVIGDEDGVKTNDFEKNRLADLGFEGMFDYPKPTSYIKFILNFNSKDDDLFLDYFGGSGTTFHSAQLMNLDEGRRKCILIEQGEYVNTIILPRIKKIAYSFDWKDGKPQSHNGLGVFIKYQRLEQYEDALENIRFNQEASPQVALAFQNYIPKYMLEMETRGSRTLLNVEDLQNPFDYRLKVWDGYTYDTEMAADLPETFNYLVGLHLQKQVVRYRGEHKYMLCWGWLREGRRLLVVWRNCAGWPEAEFAEDRAFIEEQAKGFEYDTLYTNGNCIVPSAQSVEAVFAARMIPA